MAHTLHEARDLASLQARYVGTGSADTNKHDFMSNMHRDTLNSFIGHPSLLQYAAIGLGKTREQTRVHLLERMVQPVGPPPKEEGVGSNRMKELLAKQVQEREEENMQEAAAKEERWMKMAAWGQK